MILTTIEYVISELAVFGLSRSIACIPRKTVRPTGVNYVNGKRSKKLINIQTNKKHTGKYLLNPEKIVIDNESID